MGDAIVIWFESLVIGHLVVNLMYDCGFGGLLLWFGLITWRFEACWSVKLIWNCDLVNKYIIWFMETWSMWSRDVLGIEVEAKQLK